MSFSSAPDANVLGRVAGALAVDEAFVEKDWYVVQAIIALVELGNNDINPIFSGGTSLLKGHGLIRRFSEDIDFKLALSPNFLAQPANKRRGLLGDFKEALVARWESAGFSIASVTARDANGFIKIELSYPSTVTIPDALRPHILAELSAKPPRLATQSRPLASFVNQYRRASPEVSAIDCVDAVETAADKLSAFAWRSIVRDRNSVRDDPAIVRHLHDLAALEATVIDSQAFPELLGATLVADAARGGDAVERLAPSARLAAALATLYDDQIYAFEYKRFVEGMAFAGEGNIPSFEEARNAFSRLCALLNN